MPEPEPEPEPEPPAHSDEPPPPPVDRAALQNKLEENLLLKKEILGDLVGEEYREAEELSEELLQATDAETREALQLLQHEIDTLRQQLIAAAVPAPPRLEPPADGKRKAPPSISTLMKARQQEPAPSPAPAPAPAEAADQATADNNNNNNNNDDDAAPAAAGPKPPAPALPLAKDVAPLPQALAAGSIQPLVPPTLEAPASAGPAAAAALFAKPGTKGSRGPPPALPAVGSQFVVVRKGQRLREGPSPTSKKKARLQLGDVIDVQATELVDGHVRVQSPRGWCDCPPHVLNLDLVSNAILGRDHCKEDVCSGQGERSVQRSTAPGAGGHRPHRGGRRFVSPS